MYTMAFCFLTFADFTGSLWPAATASVQVMLTIGALLSCMTQKWFNPNSSCAEVYVVEIEDSQKALEWHATTGVSANVPDLEQLWMTYFLKESSSYS